MNGISEAWQIGLFTVLFTLIVTITGSVFSSIVKKLISNFVVTQKEQGLKIDKIMEFIAVQTEKDYNYKNDIELLWHEIRRIVEMMQSLTNEHNEIKGMHNIGHVKK